MSQLDNLRMQEEEDKAEKFAQLAKLKGWYCHGPAHGDEGELIAEWEYPVYKATGYCSSCDHDIGKVMSE